MSLAEEKGKSAPWMVLIPLASRQLPVADKHFVDVQAKVGDNSE